MSGKSPKPGRVGERVGYREAKPFRVRARLGLKVVVGFQGRRLREGADWITTGFDGVSVKVASWLNSSLIKVEWEELTALCVSHLLSAFIGRNSQ